ncbi:aspartic proteinase nepenthesin-2-like [Hordeum vulgare]|nr:aspartic proteinase nepenthesin-2-like [Hordeum vulgare]
MTLPRESEEKAQNGTDNSFRVALLKMKTYVKSSEKGSQPNSDSAVRALFVALSSSRTRSSLASAATPYGIEFSMFNTAVSGESTRKALIGSSLSFKNHISAEYSLDNYIECDSRFATGAVTYVGCDVKLVAKEEELARRVPSLKLHMTHRSAVAGATGKGSFFLDSTEKDVVRIDMMHKRVTLSGSSAAQQGLTPWRALSERLVATVGVRGGRVRGYAAEPVSDDHAHRRRPQLAAARALFVYGR